MVGRLIFALPVATLAAACGGTQARVDLHLQHSDALGAIDRVEVTATRAGGVMGAITVKPIGHFFDDCLGNVVHVLVGDRAPTDIGLQVVARDAAGGNLAGAGTTIHIDRGEVKSVLLGLGGGTMVPMCSTGSGGAGGSGGGGAGGTGGGGAGGSGGSGGSGGGGAGGSGGSGGSGGTGGSGAGDLGAPCNSAADCNSNFPMCLKFEMRCGWTYPGGYCSTTCPPSLDCGPNGTWAQWSDASGTDCWCERNCYRGSDCGRSGYNCCRSSPLPDGGAPTPGVCEPRNEPDYCN
ncbi:MAG TPA: hypothetical protein VKN99_20020 [Polyangia bacterium]|nr:hypothetical protein [Polyangia bacterium]